MKNSKTRHQIFLLLISIFVLLFLQACNLINLDKTEPEKAFFSFDEIKDNKPLNNRKKLSSDLILMEFTAISEFRGNQFIYKNNSHYIKDYYNRFFTPPEKKIQNKCAQWLNSADIFNSASSTKSTISFSDFILKGKILEIYCDRSDSNASYAIIKIRFNLIEYNETNKAIMEKDLSSMIKFNSFTPANLITAWTKCLEDIFKDLESEISSAI